MFPSLSLAAAATLVLLSSSTLAIPTPRATPTTFNCTPYDLSALIPFPHNIPASSGNLFGVSSSTQTLLGFLGTDRALEEVPCPTGLWSFEVCTGFDDKVDTTSNTYNLQKLFGHVIYTRNETGPVSDPETKEKQCLGVSNPKGQTDYARLPLRLKECNETSGALEDQEGSIWRVDNHYSAGNGVFLLGPGPEGLYNATYAPGPDSFNHTTGKGVDLTRIIPGAPFSGEFTFGPLQ